MYMTDIISRKGLPLSSIIGMVFDLHEELINIPVHDRAILHDPEVWSNPEQFNPERFLKLSKEDGTYSLNPDVPNPQGVAFGFGRRICPGRYMAYESAWVIVASILATLNVEKATDSAGNLIIPAEDYNSGFVV